MAKEPPFGIFCPVEVSTEFEVSRIGQKQTLPTRQRLARMWSTALLFNIHDLASGGERVSVVSSPDEPTLRHWR